MLFKNYSKSLRITSLAIQKLIICSLLSFIGCATTQQANNVTPSGFLRNYSQLREGQGDQALLTYKNPQANWNKYSQIIISPVQVYAARDAEMNSDSREEKIALANYFNATLREKLQEHFRIVNTPGPGVLKLRVALSDADQSEVLLDTITTLMPIGLALSTVKRTVSGSDSAVGFAQAEMEVLDSQNSTRLAAAVDKRYGTKALRSKFGSWNHAQEAMDHWAEQIAAKLVESGAGHR